MTRLRSISSSTQASKSKSARAFWEGQFLAGLAATVAITLQFLLRPAVDHSTYLLGAFALLACAALRGGPSALTATIILTIGGFVADGRAGIPDVERIIRGGVFLGAGVAGAFFVQKLFDARDAPQRPSAANAPKSAEAEQRAEELHAQLTQAWSQNSMGEMASVLAHELNQPLAAVTNYLRAARTLVANLELEDDDLIDAVSRAGDQAVRAGEIVRTMRDLATRGGTHLQPVSVSACIDEIKFILGLIARDSDVRVTYDLFQGHDIVLADRTQLQQLIINLTRNAIEAVTKYPDRQVKISTSLDPEGSLLTTVEDSGPGLDPDIHDRLFQPLASTKPDGMGLGLSISSAIVHNHRGRIWVKPSRLGGAAFCFVLARAGKDGEDGTVRSHSLRRR